MINVDVNSPSFVIRYGIVDRMKKLPTFQNVKRWSMTPAPRILAKMEDNQIPYVGVYEMEELLGPDGDANHCEPRFVNTLRIGFTVIITSNDDDIADQNLDSAYWMIMNLLTNPRWATFPAAGKWNNGKPIKIESITRGSHKKIFGNSASNNETPIAELQMDLSVVHRTDFPPWPFDDLNRVHVDVIYPWPYDPNLYEPFTVQYDLVAQGALIAPDYHTLPPKFATPTLTVR